MKKLKSAFSSCKSYILLSFYFIFSILFSNAQENYYCSTPNTNAPNSPLALPTSCNNYNFYSPINDWLETKIIKVNIHVMQESVANPQNFENNQADIAYLNQIISGVNGVYANIQAPTWNGPVALPFVTDSRIQFELKNIYFDVDHAGWNFNNNTGTIVCGTYCLNNFGVNVGEEINIFLVNEPHYLTNNHAYGGCGYTQHVDFAGIWQNYKEYPPCSIVNSGGCANPLGGVPWGINALMAHELGHSLNLWHTFDPDQFSDTPSPDQSDFCDAHQTNNNCSNNLMGYSNTKAFLSPMQVGEMHRYITHDMRPYLNSCQPEYNRNIIIQTGTTIIWDIARVPAGDVIIKSGAKLTVLCDVYMREGSKVIVENGGILEIDGGGFHGNCPNLWAGIEGQFNSAIIAKNSALIEDAQYGIKANNGASILLDNTTFNKCYVGVYVPALTTGSNLISGHITGCTFKCDGLLKGPYLSQTVIDNQIPQSNWATYAGIRMDNVSFVIDGGVNKNKFIGSPVISNGLTYYCLNAGIVGKNSNLTVKKCSFLNVQNYSNYDNRSAGIYVTGVNGYYTLDVTGLGSTINDPKTFDNCSNGIVAQSMNLNIHDNFMDKVTKGLSIAWSSGRNLSIHHNLIYSDWYGIESNFNDASNSFDISSNKIHIGEYFSNNYNGNAIGTGIYFNEYSIANTNTNISGNYIYVQKALDGISLNNVKNATLAINHVYLNDPVYNRYGISIKNCQNTNINCGDVTSTAIAATELQRGIYVSTSTYSNISCMDVSNTFNGIHVDGVCSNTFLTQNSFHSHINGFKIGGTGVLPKHLNRGNKWYNNCGYKDAINTGNPLFSKFEINPWSYPYKPNSFLPSIAAGGANDFFSQGSGTPPSSCATNTCTNNSLMMSAEEELKMDEAIARGEVVTPIYALPMDFEARKYLFDKLSKNNALLQSDPEFQTFYSGEIQSNTDELRQVTEAAETIYNMTSNLSAQIEQNAESIKQNLSQISQNNDLIAASSLNDMEKENLEAVNRALGVTNQSLQNYNEVAISSLSNDRILNAENIRITNSGIITNASYDVNEKTVSDIYFNTIAKQVFKLDASQASILLSIAQQCPFAGGTAVYKARALYNIYNPNQEYEDNLICLNEGVVLRQANPAGTFIENHTSYALLHPNPANNILNIVYSFGKDIKGSLEIFTSLGLKLSTFVLSANESNASINTSELTSGIYYYQIKSDCDYIIKGKLVIAH